MLSHKSQPQHCHNLWIHFLWGQTHSAIMVCPQFPHPLLPAIKGNGLISHHWAHLQILWVFNSKFLRRTENIRLEISSNKNVGNSSLNGIVKILNKQLRFSNTLRESVWKVYLDSLCVSHPETRDGSFTMRPGQRQPDLHLTVGWCFPSLSIARYSPELDPAESGSLWTFTSSRKMTMLGENRTC